jgi:hypothetical protein
MSITHRLVVTVTQSSLNITEGDAVYNRQSGLGFKIIITVRDLKFIIMT